MLTKGEIAATEYNPEKPHWKLRDGNGLYLKLTPSGAKLWRMDFRWQGKAQVLSFGAWPDVSIDEARGLRSAAKVALKAGRDPRGPAPVIGATFGAFADRHVARQSELGRASKTVEGREALLGATGHAKALRPVPIGAIRPWTASPSYGRGRAGKRAGSSSSRSVWSSTLPSSPESSP